MWPMDKDIHVGIYCASGGHAGWRRVKGQKFGQL